MPKIEHIPGLELHKLEHDLLNIQWLINNINKQETQEEATKVLNYRESSLKNINDFFNKYKKEITQNIKI